MGVSRYASSGRASWGLEGQVETAHLLSCLLLFLGINCSYPFKRTCARKNKFKSRIPSHTTRLQSPSFNTKLPISTANRQHRVPLIPKCCQTQCLGATPQETHRQVMPMSRSQCPEQKSHFQLENAKSPNPEPVPPQTTEDLNPKLLNPKLLNFKP